MLINHLRPPWDDDPPNIAQRTGRPTHTPTKRVHMREKILGDEGNLRISRSSYRFTTDSQKNIWNQHGFARVGNTSLSQDKNIRRIKVGVKHIYVYNLYSILIYRIPWLSSPTNPNIMAKYCYLFTVSQKPVKHHQKYTSSQPKKQTYRIKTKQNKTNKTKPKTKPKPKPNQKPKSQKPKSQSPNGLSSPPANRAKVASTNWVPRGSRQPLLWAL